MRREIANISYTREDITDKIFKCSELTTSVGNIAEAYFCPYGLFTVLEELKYPIRTTYQKLRELLRLQHIYIYVPHAGLYDYYRDQFKEICLSEDEGKESGEHTTYDYFEGWYVEKEISNEAIKYSYDELIKIEERLRLADATNRGSYVDNEGNIYIKKEKGFREASPINQDKLFYFCLFGGCIGLHRFLLKKYFTGFIYMITLGLFGMGWLFDLAGIVFGTTKDKKKRVILPLTNRKRKLLFIPIGVLFNALFSSVATYIIFNLLITF